MMGRYASRVVFNYKGISENRYSRDLLTEWEGAMKSAISSDVNDEDVDADKKRLEVAWRYGQACEEIIMNLMFCVKWGAVPSRFCEDESQG